MYFNIFLTVFFYHIRIFIIADSNLLTTFVSEFTTIKFNVMKTSVKSKITEGKTKFHTFVFRNFKSATWNEKRRFGSKDSFIFS